jgi:sugar fermentation stimulation protein A
MVHNGRCWIGINTHLANHVAAEGIASGIVGELNGYDSARREVPYGGGSRIDILLEKPAGRCYVEVKNVTMVDGRARYAFPDAVTDRGRKHLAELESMVRQGHRAVMLFLIQRSDGHGFTPAADIDPAYSKALHRAVDSGVEALAYRADVTPEDITIVERVEVELGG